MGSRRRPISRLNYDEERRESACNDSDNRLQLLPTLKKGKTVDKLSFDDCLGHQKWHYKRTPAIHPALTDFGPESLQRFLQNEIAKLQAFANSMMSKQEQEMRALARSWAHARSSIYYENENGRKTFKIPRVRELQPPQDLTTSKKEKAVVRKDKKTASQISQPDGLSRDDESQQPQNQHTTAYTRPRRSVATLQRALRNRLPDLLSEDLAVDNPTTPASAAKPGRTKGSKTNKSSPFPQCLDSNKENTKPLRRSSRQSGARDDNEQSLASIARDRNSDADSGPDQIADMLDDESEALRRSTDKPQPIFKASNVRLSRASSFENHATNSRDTLRSSDKSLIRVSAAPEDVRRRRKTPAPSPVLPDLLSPSHPLLPRRVTISGQRNIPDNDESSPPALFARSASSSSGSRPDLRRDNEERMLRLDATLQKSNTTEYLPGDDGDVLMWDASSQAKLDEQQAILNSCRRIISQAQQRPTQQPQKAIPFDYRSIVPEDIPVDIKQAEINRCTIWQEHGLDGHGKASGQIRHDVPFTVKQLDPSQLNFLDAPDEHGDYPRRYKPTSPHRASREPPICHSSQARTTLPVEIWEADTGRTPGGVLQYLSSTEVRSLRLVCKSLSEDLEPYVFRNVVTKFGPELFNLQPSYSKDGKLEINGPNSMMRKHGADMNKFGISFEYDASGLRQAPFKITETAVNAWFGRYTWPVRDYPYFPALQEIDDLLDDERRLLTQTMKNLPKCRELAIALDSGHGWLEGPDISDLALYRKQIQGSRVFGRTYSAIDRAYEEGRTELFRWGQVNTINENLKYLDGTSKKSKDEVQKLRSMILRDHHSYCVDREQPDHAKHIHTGGLAGNNPPPQVPNRAMATLNAMFGTNPHNPIPPHMPPIGHPLYAANIGNNHNRRNRFQALMNIVRDNSAPLTPGCNGEGGKDEAIQPQWPLIFNGFNLAAEPRGDSHYVQARIATPSEYPLLPNHLTEPQAQWLMETSWIQRTFLSAYTDAVRVNSSVLKNVHSLHIAQISSGLLPGLSQKIFWSCLRGLRKITLLVKPDWRFEHVPGDKFFQSNMPADPISAVAKFSELLQDCIAPLENLNSLHIGYIGGGENQVGIYGRNQHVLPAPITGYPREWLIAQNSSMTRPNLNTIVVFPHVRTLKFENCWFSPLLLENFMVKSRDTSLHNLILDSVSLTAQVNSSRTDGPLRTVDHLLKCHHPPSAWLNETVPANAAWVNLLDKLTPGKTLLEHKYDANMINEEEHPRPERTFRGNIQQITLKSCGYVKVMGIPSNELNQNELVFQNASWVAMDEGLKARACMFDKVVQHDLPADPGDDDGTDNQPDAQISSRRNRLSFANGGSASVWTTVNGVSRLQRREQKEPRIRTMTKFIMLSGRSAHTRGESIAANDETANAASMTGYLTQCIHPVEKRLLERMWGMSFGWGDDMRRWEAVEDGWFMGGTGRFSGEIYRDAELQDAAAIPVSNDVNEEDESNENTSARRDTRSASRIRTRGQAHRASDPGTVTVGLDDRNSDSDEEIKDDDDDGPALNPTAAPLIPGAYPTLSACTSASGSSSLADLLQLSSDTDDSEH